MKCPRCDGAGMVVIEKEFSRYSGEQVATHIVQVDPTTDLSDFDGTGGDGLLVKCKPCRGWGIIKCE